MYPFKDFFVMIKCEVTEDSAMLFIYSPDCIIFDLETTGLDPESEEIIEISALKIVNGEVAEEFSTLVNPGRPIPDISVEITGITDNMVKDAPAISEALPAFKDFIGDFVLVGHNIRSFDLLFIQRDAIKYLGGKIANDYVDTLLLAQRYLPELESKSLGSLASHYGVSYEGAHRALADCRINFEVYKHLKGEIDNPSEAAKAVPVCPLCGNRLKKREGKFGEFWGCRSYPECRYTKDC